MAARLCAALRKHKCERPGPTPCPRQAQHSDFLEVIIIVLIFVDCVILFATLAATMGLIGGGGVGPGGHNPAQHVHSLGGLLAYVVSRMHSRRHACAPAVLTLLPAWC